MKPPNWTSPEVSASADSQAQRFYERYWEWRDENQYLYADAVPPRIDVALGALERLGRSDGIGSTLVDVGCGEGTLGRVLRQAGLGYRTVGLDISEKALSLARDHYDAVIHFDASAPLTDLIGLQSASVVTCLEVLEHVFDPAHLLREIRRVLRPGGALIASSPNFAEWRSRVTVLRGQFPSESQHVFHEAEHLHYFTQRSLIELFDTSGFDVLRCGGALFDAPPGLRRLDHRLGQAITRARPTLFARQLVLTAMPKHP